MSVAIKPTVGRKVWYRPSHFDTLGPNAMAIRGLTENAEPLDATVVAVLGDRCVNVVVLDTVGKPFTKTSVTLRQPDDAAPKGLGGEYVGGYVEWMPFQQGQARAAADVGTTAPATQS